MEMYAAAVCGSSHQRNVVQEVPEVEPHLARSTLVSCANFPLSSQWARIWAAD